MATPGNTFEEKPLPNNADAEKSVLGAICIDNKYLTEAASILHSADFFVPQNRVIFAQMLQLRDTNQPIDLVTLNDALSRDAKITSAGGIGYLGSLVDGVPAIVHVAAYAKIIKEKARLRNLVTISRNIQSRAWEERGDVSELEDQLRQALAHAVPHVNGNGSGHRHAAYPLRDFLSEKFPVPKHLVNGLIPAGGSVLILAMPHRLKSWFTTGLALGCSRPGKVMGVLDVPQAVRTLIVQVEDLEGDLQWRMRELLKATQFDDANIDNVRVIGRNQFNGGFTNEWSQWLRQQVIEFDADLVIMDVLRRFFVGRGDLNSPGDSGDFLEEIDLIRRALPKGTAVCLVHHENRKDAELMAASAGSYNFPGWANVMIQLKRKTETGQGTAQHMTMVEIECDNKLGPAPDALRLVLQLNNGINPLRLEEIGDGDDWHEAKDQLAEDWTIRDLAEVFGIHRTSALRRLKKWMQLGKVQKTSGRRGRGGQAHFTFVDGTE